MTFTFRYEVRAEPGVSAEAAVVIESQSGQILYEKNARKKMPMASTTKIMTALCAIENLHPAHPVTIDNRSAGIEGSSIYLKEGETLTVLELLYGMLLNSGNDAATALALAVSDSVEEFAVLMTETARKIGASDTNFTNPSGLYEESHYTTAYDLALITSHALSNRLFSQIVATKSAQISGSSDGQTRYLRNHNKLLGTYNGCNGVKTGYTKKCGRCLVSSAQRDSVSLICVTLNAPDDWNDHRKLLDNAFSRTVSQEIASQGDYAMQVNIGGAICRLSYEKSLRVTEIDGKTDNTKIVFSQKSDLSLPINHGEQVGTAYAMCNGKVVSQCNLVSSEAVIHPTKRKKTLADILTENLQRFF